MPVLLRPHSVKSMVVGIALTIGIYAAVLRGYDSDFLADRYGTMQLWKRWLVACEGDGEGETYRLPGVNAERVGAAAILAFVAARGACPSPGRNSVYHGVTLWL
jgi:hypothetical protein